MNHCSIDFNSFFRLRRRCEEGKICRVTKPAQNYRLCKTNVIIFHFSFDVFSVNLSAPVGGLCTVRDAQRTLNFAMTQAEKNCSTNFDFLLLTANSKGKFNAQRDTSFLYTENHFYSRLLLYVDAQHIEAVIHRWAITKLFIYFSQL